METEPRNRKRIALPLLGVLLFLAPLSGLLSLAVQHDLDATQTVGLQSRARRHHHSDTQTQQQSAVRCAVKPEKRKTTFEQCAKDERKRDDAFYRPMPRKPSNPK
ncbi:MAG: hypothetical protein ABI175_00625 [Polyangiales bacterium]